MTMMIRPLSSLKDAEYVTNCQTFVCGAEDEPEVPCTEMVIGHIWPSDEHVLKHLFSVKASRHQPFPFMSSRFVCAKHAQIFSEALKFNEPMIKVD